MVTVVKTAQGIALIALVLAFAAIMTTTIANAKLAQDNCEAIEQLKFSVRAERELTLTQIETGQLDTVFRNFYGDKDWAQRKEDAIDNLKAQIDRFAPKECPFPLLGT